MKKYIIIALLAVTAAACEAQAYEKEPPYLTKSLSGESITAVEAETSGGSIEVTGGHGTDARIDVYVSGNGRLFGKLSKAEIDERLKEYYELSVTVTDHKLVATARLKNNGSMDWNKGVSVAYRIYVPEQVSTHLGTSGGSIHISGLSGNQNFFTSGGSLHVSHLTGFIKGGTSGGSIHVYDSKDTIDLSTSGGSIHAGRCSGSIKLVTSGGSLHLDSLSGMIVATTSGGSVHGGTISGELHTSTSGGNVSLGGISGSLEASTSGGSIQADILEPGKFITLNNSGGKIDLRIPKGKGFDLKLSGKVRTNGLTGFSGTSEEGSLRGSINGGGIPVNVDAGDGRISLSFR
jgi:DUF4097 and DUF4098 domain-containing protein YvlB